MARSSAFDRVVKTAFEGAEREVQRLFVNFIKTELASEIQKNKPDCVFSFIDGAEGKQIEDVKPFGVARFEFSYLKSATAELLQIIRDTSKSPRDTGAYIASANVFVDDVPIAPVVEKSEKGKEFPVWDLSMLDQIKEESKVIVAPTVHYARKIESGKKKDGRPWSDPFSFVYRSAANSIRRRWGSVVIVTYSQESMEVYGVDISKQPSITLQRVR